MIIKCPECGHDNQLGAIFCRNCGGKLDIEEMRPEVKEDKVGISPAKLIRKLIGIVLLLAVVGLIAGLFVPYGHKEFPTLEGEENIKATDNKYLALFGAFDGNGDQYVFEFTPVELSYLYAKHVLAKTSEEDAASSYAIEKVNFATDEQGYVVITLETKMFGKVPTRFQIKGNIVNPSKENEKPGAEGFNMGFEVVEAKMGHVPMMGKFLQGKVLEKFQPLLTGGDVTQKFKDKVISVENKSGNDGDVFSIKVKEED